MSRPTFALRARRAGLVLGGAMLGAAALLAAAAGPAAATEMAAPLTATLASVDAPAQPEEEGASNASIFDPAASLFHPSAPRLAPPALPLDGVGLGETRFETMPSFVPAARSPRKAMPGAASIAWRATREPWLAASLTLAGPAALALPALMWPSVAAAWAPAALGPLALGAGHLYAGDPARGLLVGLGGAGMAGAGAAAGYGLGAWLGMPAQGAMLAGGGLGLAGYTVWAAADAFRAAGAAGQVEVVTVSPR